MKVSGFTFIRNAVTYQYPVREAILSILPLCDEVVVAVGNCNDGTRELVASIDPLKIRIIDTVWDERLKTGGQVLAAETDKALKAVSPDSDWCFYIQGDEVFHEKGQTLVHDAMQKWKGSKKVDGFLFDYLHFYGSFDYIATAGRWYKHEIRIFRNRPDIYSYKDAQGFRKAPNLKLNVKALDAFIHHYGWVREPVAMQAKQNNFKTLYEDFGAQPAEQVYTGDFDYSGIDALNKFRGTHPAVMQARITAANWKFEHDLAFNRLKLKDRFKNVLEKVTGKRPFDYQNYKVL